MVFYSYALVAMIVGMSIFYCVRFVGSDGSLMVRLQRLVSNKSHAVMLIIMVAIAVEQLTMPVCYLGP